MDCQMIPFWSTLQLQLHLTGHLGMSQNGRPSFWNAENDASEFSQVPTFDPQPTIFWL
jgi:hypothetical protein